jgi:hypothetical protein
MGRVKIGGSVRQGLMTMTTCGRPASHRCFQHVNATESLSRPAALRATFSAHCKKNMMASSDYAPEALAGFAKGNLYDQYRPSYSPESVTKLLQALRLDGASQATILDLAAGTGVFTSLLAERREQFDIFAIKPKRGMREELEKKHL